MIISPNSIPQNPPITQAVGQQSITLYWDLLNEYELLPYSKLVNIFSSAFKSFSFSLNKSAFFTTGHNYQFLWTTCCWCIEELVLTRVSLCVVPANIQGAGRRVIHSEVPHSIQRLCSAQKSHHRVIPNHEAHSKCTVIDISQAPWIRQRPHKGHPTNISWSSEYIKEFLR